MTIPTNLEVYNTEPTAMQMSLFMRTGVEGVVGYDAILMLIAERTSLTNEQVANLLHGEVDEVYHRVTKAMQEGLTAGALLRSMGQEATHEGRLDEADNVQQHGGEPGPLS